MRLAIIGGSQAYTLLRKRIMSGEKIGTINTPFGTSQPVWQLNLQGQKVLFISRHGDERYSIAAPWVNYRANIWALKELGTQAIISWSGPGAIDKSIPIGSFVVPDDVIDETKNRPTSFFEGTGLGFIRQNPVFCPNLRALVRKAIENLGLECRFGGVYVCTEGPRLETPAEIRKYALIGAHLVGMTLCPEVFLAKELEMCYAAICYVTNYAEGIRERSFEPGVLFEGLIDKNEALAVENAVSMFPRIIEQVALAEDQICNCSCQHLMERYRRRGDIGPDWHTWIQTGE
jgi:5'-methylthioadenosine phosphorylase